MQSTLVPPGTRLREELQSGLLTGYDELIPRMSWARARIREHQRTRLRALLHHAARHAPFHADRLAGVDVDRVDPDDLSALPVMSKADLMDHFDDALTDPAVTRERLEAALAGAEDAVAALPGSVLAMTSGGSSGPRGVFALDLPAARQFFGALSRGLVARLRAEGAPPGGLRIAMVGAASPVHATGAACWLTAGGKLPFRLLSVPVTQPLADIVDRLSALRPDALFGYPTMLARLAQEQYRGRLRITPSVVTCTSETLTPELRATIRAGFGVPVADTFGSSEGLVGTSAPDDAALVFAEDGCIVELVDDADRPVAPGTPSAAVLVTTLENRLQPLIRYRLTDSFTELPPVPGSGYLRAQVEGRSDDVLRFGDVALHPLVVRSVLVHRREVVDHRVRQTGRGVVVEALTCAGADRAALRTALRTDLAAALARAGLPETEVTVCTVDDLPRDPRTGKVRRVVPLA